MMWCFFLLPFFRIKCVCLFVWIYGAFYMIVWSFNMKEIFLPIDPHTYRLHKLSLVLL